MDVLVLTPSWGLGGGIERYIAGFVGAAKAGGCRVEILPLLSPGQVPSLPRKILFLGRVAAKARTVHEHGPPVRVVAAHPALGLVSALMGRFIGAHAKPLVIAYGAEVWRKSRQLSWATGLGARIVAISDFTAGSLVRLGPVEILPPSLERGWFNRLADAGVTRQATDGKGPLNILSVFRLASAEEKGLRELVEAVVGLPDPVTLTIAGSGSPPLWAAELLAGAGSNVHLVQNPSDGELARLYVDADVSILCTRVRSNRHKQSGEGFGLALIEGQLAGAAAIGPAAGGSAGAYVEGLTGLRPVREGPDEVARLLKWCLAHRNEVQLMGRRGHEWARDIMDPDRYRERVQLLLDGPETGRSGTLVD